MDRVNVDCIVIDGDNRLNRLNRPLDKSHCVWRRQWGKDISSKNGWNQYIKKPNQDICCSSDGILIFLS